MMSPSEAQAVNEQLTAIMETLADVRERMVKVETNSEYLRKAVEGNGKKGLLQRVDELEAERDEKKGMSRLTKRLIAGGIALLMSAAGAGWKLVNDHTARQTATEHQLELTDQRMADDIKVVQRDVQTMQQALKDHDAATRPKRR